MKYMGGGTNTADAIRYMRENMFTQSSGARPNVPRIGKTLRKNIIICDFTILIDTNVIHCENKETRSFAWLAAILLVTCMYSTVIHL